MPYTPLFQNLILIDFVVLSVENTRTVSRNLRCKNIEHDDKANANRVDVLIPDVIQVYYL